MLDFGILWMNARNLLYIKKFNPAKAIRLADDKVKTRRFLEARWIPVPVTFDVIRDRKQLYSYNFHTLPEEEFIVKPNQGSRGRGIYRVKLLEQQPLPAHFSRRDAMSTTRSPYRYEYYHVNKKVVDDTALRRYMVDILDGKSSLSSRRDTILIEELLSGWSGFEHYCEHGLADIRIIVFNLVPVAAMLRVPTEQSEGKANLDRGAVGLWVEVGSGKIVSMYQHGKVSYRSFPEPYTSFAHRYLPYREDILSYSSKIQYFANLGFLALDRVITEDGPKLLEINARAWLKFQLASLLPLRRRLQKIADIKVTTPEKGVQIAQNLFSEQKTHTVAPSKVLYLSQHGTLYVIIDKKKQTHDVIVEVDVNKKYSYCSKTLYDQMQAWDEISTELRCAWHSIRFFDLKRKHLKGLAKNKVLLWRDAVQEYYIKPIQKIYTTTDFINPKNLQSSEVDTLHIVDQKISHLGRMLNLSNVLRPLNFLDELDTFISKKGKYNPRFTYRRPSDSTLKDIEKEIHGLRKKHFGTSPLESKFAQLFLHKIQELQQKLVFVHAYKSQDFETMDLSNKALYGEIKKAFVENAEVEVKENAQQERAQLGPILPLRKVKETIEGYLRQRGLHHIKIAFDANTIGRMTITRGLHITIRINHDTVYREKDLLAILAHEIDVHVRRYQAGLQTGRHIFRNGTAGYLVDEEGLAIYHSLQKLPQSYQKIGMYEKYMLVAMGDSLDFAWLVEYIRHLRSKSLVAAFKTAFRIKKWIEQTYRVGAGSSYYKDKIYLDGYTKIQQRIEKGGDMEKLMIGKIKIEDLSYL